MRSSKEGHQQEDQQAAGVDRAFRLGGADIGRQIAALPLRFGLRPVEIGDGGGVFLLCEFTLDQQLFETGDHGGVVFARRDIAALPELLPFLIDPRADRLYPAFHLQNTRVVVRGLANQKVIFDQRLAQLLLERSQEPHLPLNGRLRVDDLGAQPEFRQALTQRFEIGLGALQILAGIAGRIVPGDLRQLVDHFRAFGKHQSRDPGGGLRIEGAHLKLQKPGAGRIGDAHHTLPIVDQFLDGGLRVQTKDRVFVINGPVETAQVDFLIHPPHQFLRTHIFE